MKAVFFGCTPWCAYSIQTDRLVKPSSFLLGQGAGHAMDADGLANYRPRVRSSTAQEVVPGRIRLTSSVNLDLVTSDRFFTAVHSTFTFWCCFDFRCTLSARTQV